MPEKAWKVAERTAAALFGCLRRPLSGSNSRSGDCDDCAHPRLFIEVKYRAKHTVWSLWSATKRLAMKSGKPPVIILRQRLTHGELVCIHSSDLPAVCQEWAKANNYKLIKLSQKSTAQLASKDA